MASKSDLELVIFHFNRTEYEAKFSKNIPAALKYLMVLFSNKIFSSKILSFTQDLDFFKLLTGKLKDVISKKKIKLLYRSSDHNFTAKSFHKHCDGHGPTITIIQSNYGNIFGGYAPGKWPTSKVYSSKDIFLFLIRSNDETQKSPLIFDAFPGKKPVIECDKDRGPVFGGYGTIEISIGDKCDKSSLSRHISGFNTKCYTFHKTGQYDFSELKRGNTLCGAPLVDGINYLFKVIDYEIFEIN